jgi:hypothetical protein
MTLIIIIIIPVTIILFFFTLSNKLNPIFATEGFRVPIQQQQAVARRKKSPFVVGAWCATERVTQQQHHLA